MHLFSVVQLAAKFRALIAHDILTVDYINETTALQMCETDDKCLNQNLVIEPLHEIFNNVVCATSKASDQPAHARSLIRAFASRFNTV